MEKQSRGSLENSEHRQSAFWVPEVKGQRDMKAEAARQLCLPRLVLTGKGDKAGRVCIPHTELRQGIGGAFSKISGENFPVAWRSPRLTVAVYVFWPFST